MVRSRILLAALCGILLSITGAGLSAQVTVVLFQPPPNQLRVSDLWRVELFNSGDETFSVYLHGVATEARDGLIVDARSSTFDLKPGRLAITGAQLEPIKVDQSHPRYRDIVTRTGSVPSGEYEICVTVIDARTGEELGRDCITQIVERVSEPLLVSPPDESDVTEPLPAFTWTPPVPLPDGGRVTYRLRIAEILGRQTAFDAIQSNPSTFERENIPTTIFQYPASSRGLITGKRYAWRITAFLNGAAIGESEVWQFTKAELMMADEIIIKDLSDTKLKADMKAPPIATLLSFKADSIYGGRAHAVAITGDKGEVATWGNNEFGQLGTGGTPVTRAKPTQIASLNYVTNLAAGAEHTLAIGPYGQVAVWGNNDYGQLGNNSNDASNQPKWIPSLTGASDVAAGSYHSVISKADGTVWAWGYNRSGELGVKDRKDRKTPTKVSSLSNIIAVAAGDGHTLALNADGVVWAWGTNRNGQVNPDIGAEATYDSPVTVAGLSNVIAIAAGSNFSLALLKDGTIRAWGANNSGQLGSGDADAEATLLYQLAIGTFKAPTKTDLESGKSLKTLLGGRSGGTESREPSSDVRVRTPAAGVDRMARTAGSGDMKRADPYEDGGLLMKEIQLGLAVTNVNGVVKVSGLNSVKRIDAGGAHSLALRSDSTIWAWGNNYWGALGEGTRANHDGPTRVLGLDGALLIAAGHDYSMAVNKVGNVYAWGNNASKQLGMDEVPASASTGGEGEEQVATSPIIVPK